MDAVELVEWQALYTVIEPLPEDRADLRMGITVANGLAPYVKKGHTLRPSDFIPTFGDAKPKPKGQSMAMMKAQWARACKLLNRGRK